MTRLDHLFMTVISKFKYAIKDDVTHTSGYYALELLVNVMRRVATEPKLLNWKWQLNQLLIKYTFYFDKLFNDAYEEMHKRERSIHVPDKAVFITVTTPRLLLIDYFMALIGVSVGQRRSAATLLNPRVIDIVMLWVREQFGNAFVMVILFHQSRFIEGMEKAISGHLEDFLVDVFIKLNMLSFLSNGLDQCLNREGGSHSRYEDRLAYITSIIITLRKHQDDKELAKFYEVVKRMGTWKKMINYVE